MNKNFSIIKTNIGAEVGDTSTAFATLLGRFVNRRYFQILRAINWKNIQPDYTFDTVVGTQRYVLPNDFGKAVSCNDITNSSEIGAVSLESIYSTYGKITDSGEVERYAVLEDTIQSQPTSASVLAIVSSSASDTSQTIFIRGISGGIEVTESVSLTGTSSANSANSYTRVKSISKSATTAGSVTITANSAAVTVATIAAEELITRYKIFIAHYVPAEVITIALPYTIKPLPLNNDYDYPVIDIADLLEIGAMADAWRYKKFFSKAQALEIMFAQQLQDYIWEKENEPNEIKQFVPQGYSRDIY
ncbi:MAG TPA: hypothetical protein PLE33_08970 [Candidatus Cloacimonas sp.]|nr:hypothetical protein [Candidatus Cloacimonas sp.]HPS61372.1 hypothetical protein [Candidatus Cloacimonas sp.]